MDIQLPHEMWENIFLQLDVRDISRLLQTSKIFRPILLQPRISKQVETMILGKYRYEGILDNMLNNSSVLLTSNQPHSLLAFRKYITLRCMDHVFYTSEEGSFRDCLKHSKIIISHYYDVVGAGRDLKAFDHIIFIVNELNGSNGPMHDWHNWCQNYKIIKQAETYKIPYSSFFLKLIVSNTAKH